MKSRVKYEAVATIGKFRDKVTGEEKKQFLKVGTVFESEDGRLSLKLDAVPCSPDWSGFISFYEPKRDGAPSQQRQRPIEGLNEKHGRGMPPAPADVPDNHDDDDIPF